MRKLQPHPPSLFNQIIDLLTSLDHKNIWLSVDFFWIRAITRSNILPDDLLTEIVNSVCRKKKIFISCFNFDFAKTGYFNPLTCGTNISALSRAALKIQNSKRTPNPFYSLWCCGPNAEPLHKKLFNHNTGPHSLFAHICDLNTVLVTVGHHFNKSYSMVHHSENLLDVPYRHSKIFPGIIEYQGTVSSEQITFYVRNVDLCDYSALNILAPKMFLDEGILKIRYIQNNGKLIPCHVVKLRESVEVTINTYHKTPLISSLKGRDCLSTYAPITAKIADEMYKQELLKLNKSL